MNLCFIFTSALFVSIAAEFKHSDRAIVLCSDTETDFMYGLNGEEKWHADFIQKKGVMTLPDFADSFSYREGTYETADKLMQTCKTNLDMIVKDYNYPAIPKVPPVTSIYTKKDMELGTKNTLICYIAVFYPPQVKVTWSKNNKDVTNETILSRYHINTDDTFNLVSSLSFTPEQGDIYTCTVSHTALVTPMTKTWEVDVEQPSVGPAVFCGVGLVVGLLGVATGTFFLVKGNNCN